VEFQEFLEFQQEFLIGVPRVPVKKESLKESGTPEQQVQPAGYNIKNKNCTPAEVQRYHYDQYKGVFYIGFLGQ